MPPITARLTQLFVKLKTNRRATPAYLPTTQPIADHREGDKRTYCEALYKTTKLFGNTKDLRTARTMRMGKCARPSVKLGAYDANGADKCAFSFSANFQFTNSCYCKKSTIAGTFVLVDRLNSLFHSLYYFKNNLKTNRKGVVSNFGRFIPNVVHASLGVVHNYLRGFWRFY
ncbi:unnamed protein product [Parnassius mnemosyne]|uniref:Uncharacterized protein n=1 Tax=Parnassius mnemosyne TaxID=213953 RepID=A0AAV1K928_9NEOP